MAIKVLKYAEKTRGVTYVEAGLSDVLGHDCASPDDDMIADHDREDGGIRPDAYAITKLG